MSKLDTKAIKVKLDEVFKKLNSAAKINVLLRFVLHKVEVQVDQKYYDFQSTTKKKTFQ